MRIISNTKKVMKSGMYSVISDCCTDMICDNLSVCIRYVDMENLCLHESFIQFLELNSDELDAESITNKILLALKQGERFTIPIQKCVAQAADGASVMSGKDNGVQKLLRDKTANPCIFVHCYAHRLNLVLSVTSTSVQQSKEFFDMLKRTISFVNVSMKRKAIFEKLQKIDDQDSVVLSLPDLCDHKWNFRERAVNIIHKRFSHLLETLDEIGEKGKPDERADAEGLLKQWKMPQNVVLLVIFSDIFAQTGPLSDVLQSEKCDLANAVQLSQAHTTIFKNKRNDEYFKKIWTISYTLATANEIEMKRPGKRVRQAPSRLRAFLIESTTGDRQVVNVTDEDVPEAYYRSHLYYPVMDKLIQEMERRFCDEEVVPLLKSISACHPDSSAFLNFTAIKPLAEAYQLNETGSLESELEVCKVIIKNSTKPDDIFGVLNLLMPPTGFPNLRRILQLALTIPVANVAAERSFSSMRRLRTYIRSSMKEERLSSLANLSLESELAKNINYDELIDIFCRLPQLREHGSDVTLSSANCRKVAL
jgi:hypothetical protein